MTDQEFFNVIVGIYSKLGNNVGDGVVQNIWESIFNKILGYNTNGEDFVKTIAPNHMSYGSNSIDFLLMHNKMATCRISFCKPEDFKIAQNYFLQVLLESQLTLGVLIGKSIYVYCYNNDKKAFDFKEIEITQSNPIGTWWVSAFKKNTFDHQQIADYIIVKPKPNVDLSKVIADITPELLYEILRVHLSKTIDLHQWEQISKTVKISVLANKVGTSDWLTRMDTMQNNNAVATVPINPMRQPMQPRPPIDRVSSAIVSNTIQQHKTQSQLDNGIIQRQTAVRLVLNEKIGHGANISFLLENKSLNKYFATVPMDYLKQDWVLIFNDSVKRQINVFLVPAKALNKKQFMSVDKLHFNIQVRCKDMAFQDEYNKLRFDRYFVKAIYY
ncbi:MAG: hypothetical protein FWF56_03170 [Firmicutes bacterium]|nr:hypothetical protein [Bacillota bacterium]MCL1953710.1 hypothetical protein [Bacillota bacterium]